MGAPRCCPSCGMSVPGQENLCPGCGWDLAMASLLGVEREPAPARSGSEGADSVSAAPSLHARRSPARSRRRGPSLTVLVILAGGGLLATGALALWAFWPRRPAPSKPILVLDWPAKERFLGRVVIDGRAVQLPDSGPVQYSLEFGKHTVDLRREGYERIKVELAMKECRRYVYQPKWTLAVLDLAEDEAPLALGPPPLTEERETSHAKTAKKAPRKADPAPSPKEDLADSSRSAGKDSGWGSIIGGAICLIVLGFLAIGALAGHRESTTTTTVVKLCSRCQREVPLSSQQGQRCPYCGAYWSGETFID